MQIRPERFMARRPKPGRKKADKATKAKSRTTPNLQPGATRRADKATTAQGQTTPVVTPEPPQGWDSNPWWPEFDAAAIERAKEKASLGEGGMLAELHRRADARLVMRAVNEQWPIPEEARARIVWEASMLAVGAKDVKAKLYAMRIMLAMQQSNNRKDLPTQVTVVTPSTGSIPVYQLIQELSRDPMVMDALDYRPVKDDSYAETSDD